MTIDLMDQQPQTVKYPLYDEARTTVIGHLVPDHEGYLMVEDEALGANIDQNGGLNMNDAINRLDKAKVLLNLARSDAIQGDWPHAIQELQQCIRDMSVLHNELRDAHLPTAPRGMPHIAPITTQLAHMPSLQP